ncbi:CoA-binding protein [Geodermatophilus sabuli]|uniref:CoA-binding protein n=1 Tax=Geodermatophilus sabuli TaxID=1564158 RepID=A0A7K3VW60_9ACTN|nr:CoA-binding protein [Geodermatophilus sabuli]
MSSLDYQDRRRLVTPERLHRFFGSRRIAVVGASDSSSWAVNLMGSLRHAGGHKELTFVHPKHNELFGQPTIPNLRDLDEPADMAFILVGPTRVEEILEDAAAAGVKNAVILAAGYGETGDDGRARQHGLAQLALGLDITIMGPNTIGFINAPAGVAPWAVATNRAPLRGPVGAVFESGSMARATHEFAQAHGVGSTLWASVGNSAVMTSLDILEYLLEDEATKSVALFLESVREPERLMELGRKSLELDKPIVAFKAGRSEEGKRSASAHTGAVATDDAVVDAAFRQAGIVRVESIEELVSTAALLGYHGRRPTGRRMGVVTSSGGGCNIIADLAVANGLELPPWDEKTVANLSEHLPPFASILNPLDTTGYGHARARPRPTKAEDDLMEIAVQDPGIDFMFTMMTPLPATRPDDPTFIESRLEILGDIVKNSPVPVFLSSNTCLDVPEYPQRLLASSGLFLMPGGDLAMSSLGSMMRWIDQRDRILARGKTAVRAGDDSAPAIEGAWAEDEGRALLASNGVPMVPAELVTTADDAAAAALRFDGAAAMKICSRAITHKSDVGGVVLGVDGSEAVHAAYERISTAVRRKVPDADLRGVLVSPMRTGGQELLVGITMDPTFGPVLAVGLGGIWVEILRDVSLRVLPVDAATVKDMLLELTAVSLLQGARGATPADVDAVSDVIVQIAQAALALGDRLETLEVNPLRVDGSVVEGLDVLVVTVGDKPAEQTGVPTDA